MAEPIAVPRPNSGHDVADASRLLERVAAGDRDAFREFYERYGARVMAVARRWLVARELVEELVQDVFV
ncbi:MAG TPA: RNA polymerase subunit sigma-24, partial [Candidatus Methylomirabilis sp.]|nr:RNA polymerase subunit sigma-24 [Candidatus Methylomirabilis sp.]